MVNPTHSYPPSAEPGPFNINRYARVVLHELDDGTFVNVSHGSPVPVLNHVDIYVHDGYAYHANFYYASIGGGASVSFLLRTAAGSSVHLTSYIATVSGGPCTLYLFEGGTVSSVGTPVVAYNHDRTSTNTSTAVLSGNPAVTGGVAIETHLIPSGHKDGGLSPGTTGGWILKPEEDYYIKLQNDDSSAISAEVEVMFHDKP